MRTVAFLVGFFVLLAIAVIAGRIGVYLLSDPPTIEVETTLAADLGEPVAEEIDRGESPTASIGLFLNDPDHFVIHGYVVPGHNDGSKLSVDIWCVNRRGVAEIDETFYDDVTDGRGGRSIAIAVRTDDASYCSISASAGPRTYVGVPSPKKDALARITLYCPSACAPVEPASLVP